MFCPKCGTELPETGDCPACGEARPELIANKSAKLGCGLALSVAGGMGLVFGVVSAAVIAPFSAFSGNHAALARWFAGGSAGIAASAIVIGLGIHLIRKTRSQW